MTVYIIRQNGIDIVVFANLGLTIGSISVWFDPVDRVESKEAIFPLSSDARSAKNASLPELSLSCSLESPEARSAHR